LPEEEIESIKKESEEMMKFLRDAFNGKDLEFLTAEDKKIPNNPSFEKF